MLFSSFADTSVTNRPTVVRLPVHLPDEQTVTFDEHADLHEVADNQRDTMLMAWFRYNTDYADGRDLCYVDFPCRFKWNSQGQRWQRRANDERDNTIGRVYFVSPRSGEQVGSLLCWFCLVCGLGSGHGHGVAGLVRCIRLVLFGCAPW